MKKTTRKWLLSSRNFGGISALFLSLVTSSSAAPPPVHVDACKLVDLASVNAAAQAWFGFPVTLAQDSASGTGSGTCDFTTDKPKHIDISIFYAPSADASRYGLGQPPPPNEVPVSGAGDRAVFDQDAVVGEYAGEALVGGRQRHGPLQRRAIAIECEIAKADSAAVAAAQDRPAAKVGSGV